jgi:aminoglycoside 6'-N-acetyltransferase I
VKVVRCTDKHVSDWLSLRCELWPDASEAALRDELATVLRKSSYAGFLAMSPSDEVLGFAEAALRNDYVNGCTSSPVVFLEGIYVRPFARGTGVARALCQAVEAWGQAHGCTEIASDAEIHNVESQAMHKSLGFTETERVVFFRKAIGART